MAELKLAVICREHDIVHLDIAKDFQSARMAGSIDEVGTGSYEQLKD